MVSIGTGLKLGGLAVAGLLGFVLVKNAGNIGSKVGGFFGQGLTDLGSGITSGFESAFNIFGGATDGASGSVNNQNTVADNIVQAGSIVSPDPNHKEISVPFKSFIESGSISESFAEKFSFQPPAQGDQLDVSNTFGYLGSQEYKTRLETNQQSFNNNFGGYGSAQLQANALAKEIERSASLYPEYG